MTVFDNRLQNALRAKAAVRRAGEGAAGSVGWVSALLWPAVLTAVVAGALLGSEARLLLIAGLCGVLFLLLRQGFRYLAASVREASAIIDNAPGGTESERP